MHTHAKIRGMHVHKHTYTQMGTGHLKTWNDPFSWDRANMWCGMVGWLAISLQILTSLPFVRRKFYETFYWSHMNFKFVALVCVCVCVCVREDV